MTNASEFNLFIDDDEGYLRWIEVNPEGFVVNSYKKPNPSYLVLHRATCAHICSEANTNWTTTDYLKVCSPSVSALASWAEKEVGGSLEPCQVCKPDLT